MGGESLLDRAPASCQGPWPGENVRNFQTFLGWFSLLKMTKTKKFKLFLPGKLTTEGNVFFF